MFKPGQAILMYKSYRHAEGPTSKLLLRWRGPYAVCSQLSVVYRARLTNDTRRRQSTLPTWSPTLDGKHRQHLNLKTCGIVFTETNPPTVDHPDEARAKIESSFVDRVVDHRRGPDSKIPHNYKYRLRLRGYGPKSDLDYRADEIPQCHELIAAYRTQKGLQLPIAPPSSPSLPSLSRGTEA